jgi:hypothetical protein
VVVLQQVFQQTLLVRYMRPLQLLGMPPVPPLAGPMRQGEGGGGRGGGGPACVWVGGRAGKNRKTQTAVLEIGKQIRKKETQWLTISDICVNVTPNLTVTVLDALYTGRAAAL